MADPAEDTTPQDASIDQLIKPANGEGSTIMADITVTAPTPDPTATEMKPQGATMTQAGMPTVAPAGQPMMAGVAQNQIAPLNLVNSDNMAIASNGPVANAPQPLTGTTQTVVFADKKSSFPGGNLQIQFDRPFYEPGSVVNCVVYLNAVQSLSITSIEISFTSSEKCSFTHYWVVSTGSGKNRSTSTRSRPLNHEDSYFDVRESLYSAPPGTLMQAGHYAFQIKLKLPSNICTSLYYKEKSREEAVYDVNYLAVVRLTGSTLFTYEKALIVRQPPIDTPDKLW